MDMKSALHNCHETFVPRGVYLSTSHCHVHHIGSDKNVAFSIPVHQLVALASQAICVILPPLNNTPIDELLKQLAPCQSFALCVVQFIQAS